MSFMQRYLSQDISDRQTFVLQFLARRQLEIEWLKTLHGSPHPF